jgi:hypothetical protein
VLSINIKDRTKARQNILDPLINFLTCSRQRLQNVLLTGHHAHYTVDNKGPFANTGTPRTPDITSDAEFIERQNLFTDFLNSPVPPAKYMNCV